MQCPAWQLCTVLLEWLDTLGQFNLQLPASLACPLRQHSLVFLLCPPLVWLHPHYHKDPILTSQPSCLHLFILLQEDQNPLQAFHQPHLQLAFLVSTPWTLPLNTMLLCTNNRWLPTNMQPQQLPSIPMLP